MKKLLIIIFIVFATELNASHIIGGDITYECLGGNDYKIIMTLYRDCSGITLGDDEVIEIASSCQGAQFLDLLAVDLSPNDPNTNGIIDTSYLCSGLMFNTTCNGGDFPGIMIHRYEGVVNLAPCVDWSFTWSSCCRNPAYEYPVTNDCGYGYGSAITRVVNPSSLGMQLKATLDNVNGICNSSPNFINTPRAFICQNTEVILDQSGIDIDGDSLYYELVSPLDDGNVNLAFEAGFSYLTPLSLTPASQFEINHNTGVITFNAKNYGAVCNDADTLEQTTIAIKVSQFRSGNLIGTTFRDMQIVTLPGCDIINPVNLGIQTINNGNSFINDSTLKVCAGDTLEFSIRIVDFQNQNDTFNVYSNIDQVINASYSNNYNGGNDVTTTFKLSPDIADLGFHYFSILINNSGCPIAIEEVFDFYLEVDSCYGNLNFNKLIINKTNFIYPNPAQNTINFNYSGNDNIDIQIIDITGKIVDQFEINKTSKNRNLDFESGIYLVKSNSKDFNQVQKLIIE